VPGETVLQAAQRECEEEIGVRFSDWRYLESSQPERKIDWYIHIFLASSPSETVPTRHDGGENIEMYQVSYEEFLKRGRHSKRVQIFDECSTLDELLARAQPV
jgi:8-oxo-dGTP pyrophosphatase MutT (NUDIX family)